jgi:hypothetical protein
MPTSLSQNDAHALGFKPGSGAKMPERKLVTVECPECGLRAELREKAEGRPKTHFDDVVSA